MRVVFRKSIVLLLAAVGLAAAEVLWVVKDAHSVEAPGSRIVFLLTQALFLALSASFVRRNAADVWSFAAAVVTGCVPLIAYIYDPEAFFCAVDSGFATLMLSSAGLIALAVVHQRVAGLSRLSSATVAIAFGLTWIGERKWFGS